MRVYRSMSLAETTTLELGPRESAFVDAVMRMMNQAQSHDVLRAAAHEAGLTVAEALLVVDRITR